MTAVEVLGSIDELTEGTNSSLDAVIGAAIDPCRTSRLHAPDRRKMQAPPPLAPTRLQPDEDPSIGPELEAGLSERGAASR